MKNKREDIKNKTLWVINERGVSQSFISKKANIDKFSLNKFLKGHIDFGEDRLDRLEKVINEY